MLRDIITFAGSFCKAAVPFFASSLLFLVAAAMLSQGDYVQFLKALLKPIVTLIKLACIGVSIYCLWAACERLLRKHK